MVVASAGTGANAASVGRIQESSLERQQSAGNARSGSGFCEKVVNISKFMFQATGATALVAIAATNPTITSALSSVFSKVAAAFDQGGAFVSANIASFAFGSVAAGAFNVVDGITAIAVNSSRSRALTKLNDSQLAGTQERAKAFSNLKKMYAAAQRRGSVQVAIGAAAAAVGVLALAGVISNPFGLAAAGGVASLVLAGVQLHKFVQNRRIKAEMVKFKAALPAAESQVEHSRIDCGSSSSDSDEILPESSPRSESHFRITEPLVVEDDSNQRRERYIPVLSPIESAQSTTPDIDTQSESGSVPSSRYAFVHEADSTVSPAPTPRSGVSSVESVDGSPKSDHSETARLGGRSA